MNKSTHLLLSVFFCSAVFSAEGVSQIDREALNALSPVAYEVIKTIEAERGYPFASHDELKLAMASDDFKNRQQNAMQLFCAKAESHCTLEVLEPKTVP
ncbi:hypothetical protein HW932_18620 [Allochromatium humboldtianum]|uniref:Uncharacterized protein n=1 Tax=Allochromatium humboldtianum TaxID=504901 RepID=A0A850RD50_9GAMM|nr:hypothetical protein [Allochromatium humboldtianum]NVZ11268.1 hypothetical protein [Allochromatium humboldtianum]